MNGRFFSRMSDTLWGVPTHQHDAVGDSPVKPMARYKTSNYDQTHLIPVCLEDQLLEGSLEHTIHVLVENKMDMSLFDARYHNERTGCPPTIPKSC